MGMARLPDQSHAADAQMSRRGWWGPRPLLGQRGSLTKALGRRLAAEVVVELLASRPIRLHGLQARRLRLKPGSQALRREVFLWCGGQRVLFARSIFPLASLRGKGRCLKHLGQRPLGDFLFAGRRWSATVQRRRMVMVRLLRGHEDYLALRAWPATRSFSQPLWGRRSTLLPGAAPITIHEYVLAASTSRAPARTLGTGATGPLPLRSR
jgi:chorismate--pyruvate lyase